MVIMDTKLADVKILKPTLYADTRGSFFEVWRDEWLPLLPRGSSFVQDNHSLSRQSVLRGLHFQVDKPQGKLVRVVEGAIFDVAVDVRPGSSTFGQWVGYELSAGNGYQMWIPPGFAHGFYVLSQQAITLYKCTEYYDPTCERAILWDDPTLAIEWPLLPGCEPLLSDKDAAASLLTELSRP
jgi:dTDP-4-dehydrorhamnose 3,5-epimerase